MKNQSIREYINNFNNGQYNSKDVSVQCDAGWYDWFCKDSSLRNKTYSLTAKLKQIVASPKVNQDTMYVFFKNNYPCVGKLYDDFRICDMVTGDVVYTICPAVGYTKTFGQSEVWGKENDFKEALVAGTWNDVLFFFTGVDQKKVQEEKKLLKALEAERKAEKKIHDDAEKIANYLSTKNKVELISMFGAMVGDQKLRQWAKETGIIK